MPTEIPQMTLDELRAWAKRLPASSVEGKCVLDLIAAQERQVETTQLAEAMNERDRLAAELERTQRIMREFESRVEADRQAGLRVIEQLREENRKLRGGLQEAVHGSA